MNSQFGTIKKGPRNLQHEEQIEWIFYSLLNTINAYVKMKKKSWMNRYSRNIY